MTSAPTMVLVVEDEAAAARVLMDEVGAAAGFVVAGHTRGGFSRVESPCFVAESSE